MKHNGPWKIHDSKKLFGNFWMTLQEDSVVTPDGRDASMVVTKVRKGVSILPIDENGFVYLGKQFRYIMRTECIEAVGGAVNDEEVTINAAKRELREELGLEARKWIDMGSINPFTSIIESSQQLFVATGLSMGNPEHDATENIKPVKVTLRKAAEMVMDSTITHAPSCIIILKAREYFRKHESNRGLA